MKNEYQMADILKKALGSAKFAELSARIGVKKAWDMKKSKKENVGGDFLSGHGWRSWHNHGA